MILSPHRPTAIRPVALIDCAVARTLRVITADVDQLVEGRREVEIALSKLKRHAIYVRRGVERLKRATPATQWTMTTWRDRPTSIRHEPSGVVASTLRGALDESTDPFADLCCFIDWAESLGVSPGSLSTMASSLLAASLGAPVRIGVDARLGRAAFYGPRQQIKAAAQYHDLDLWDIKAAYPSAMARGPVALSLRRVDPSTRLVSSTPGLVGGTMHVPKSPYPPVPRRVGPDAIQFPWGTFTGVWTWAEACCATERGCELDVTACWAPRREADLFGPWWRLVQSGRDLPGGAGQLAKAVLNGTWGTFAMRGSGRGSVRWADDRGEDPIYLASDEVVLPHERTTHIAAEVTSRVRIQALTEGMTGEVLHLDTDGVMVRGGTEPTNQGDGFGQWRMKETMKIVEIRAPQFYRFTRFTGDQWHYVTSGIPSLEAARLYGRDGAMRTEGAGAARFLDGASEVGVGRYDAVYPACDAQDRAALVRLMTEAA